MVGGRCLEAGGSDLRRDQPVQPPALALRKARVGDLLEHGMSHPPARARRPLRILHQDLCLFELLDLGQGRLRIDDGQLMHVEAVHEDGDPPRNVAQPRRKCIEPCTDDRLDGGRHNAGGGPRAVAFSHQHAGRLDDEERVAASSPGDL